MSTAMMAIEEPRLVHALPGRMRVHLAGWPPAGQCAVEARLRLVPGVRGVQANPLTGNVLIHFDPTTTDQQTLLAVVQTLKPESISHCREILPVSPASPRRQRRSRSAPDAGLRLAGDPDVAGPASLLPNGWPRRLSLEMVDLSLKAAGIAVSLLLTDSPLGLILSGAEVVRLFMDVVRLFMKIIGWQSARRRGEAQQYSLVILIDPDDASVADVPEPVTWGGTRHYARARGRHSAAVGPAAL